MTDGSLGRELDLLANYPKTKRDVRARADEKTEEDRAIARQFGKAFFDGKRRHGYGGFHYHPRFWEPVVPTFQSVYGLDGHSTVLDIGCAKGFMLYDFQRLIPGITLRGIDISEYAIEASLPEVKPFLDVGNATELPYPNDSFDLVIAINTLHNLEGQDLINAFLEVMRVARGCAFVTVDAYRNEAEKEAMLSWNLTAKTIKSVEEWKAFFRVIGYTGDFFWFTP